MAHSVSRENPYIDRMPTSAPRRHVLVPIRSLGPSHRDRIATHLLALSPQDRYLRFGYAATDEQVRRYASGLDFGRDDIFGIYDRRLRLIAVAHLAVAPGPDGKARAEFGVSVLPHARGRGYGARLFERAVMHARNVGQDTLFIHALTENAAMLKIVRKAGAVLERHGAETDAMLRMPAADLESRMTELIEEQFALADYGIKARSKDLRDALAPGGL